LAALAHRGAGAEPDDRLGQALTALKFRASYYT
jgi:hypothetical protein